MWAEWQVREIRELCRCPVFAFVNKKKSKIEVVNDSRGVRVAFE